MTTLAAKIRRLVTLALIWLIVAVCVLYLADYARLRYKIHRNSQAYGSVKIQNYYAVKLKSGKVEYYFDNMKVQPCSNTLFPQMGYTPCWYLQRQANKGTNL